MRDGKALQAATSHYLGQGFARAFDVHYTGRDGSEQYPYATSWGATTRLVGGVVMAHGDDRGLRLPPRVAPHQAVIVPIFREDERAEVLQAAAAVADELRAASVRVRVDDRPEHRPGFKFNEWELKGVPLRIEIGGRDLAAAAVTVARRDTGDKQQIPLPRAAVAIDEMLRRRAGVALPDRPRRTGAADAPRPPRLRRDDRVPPRTRRIRRGTVVRQRRVRGARQGRQLGDDPVPAARRATDDQSGACVCCGRSAVAAAVWAQAY